VAIEHPLPDIGPKPSFLAGLDFIKAAFCPLEFTATKLGKHPQFKQLRKDAALAVLAILLWPLLRALQQRDGLLVIPLDADALLAAYGEMAEQMGSLSENGTLELIP
jgi:hypothetical protein